MSAADSDTEDDGFVTLYFSTYPEPVEFKPGPPMMVVRGMPPLRGENYVDYSRRIAAILRIPGAVS